MAKRIKNVFSTGDQVLHLWANQSQASARSSNVFFDGNMCFSYGRHYILGKLVKYKGKTVALINDRGYSVTTGKHINSAWDSVSHLPRIKSSELDVHHGLRTTREKLQKQLDGLLLKRSFYQKSFGPNDYLYQEVTAFNKLCKTLGEYRQYRVLITAKFVKEVNSHIDARAKRELELKSPEALAKKEAKRAKNALKELEKAKEQVEAWRNGGLRTNAVASLMPRLLRINGNQVETSGGAFVPLNDAVRLLGLVELGNSIANEKVGHFSVSKVDGDIVQIGCHKIAISEAKTVLGSVAPKLQLVQSA